MEKSDILATLGNTLDSSKIEGLGNRVKGKVRDIYDCGDKLVFITTDRQSAFDRVLALVPYKGAVLTQTSCFWFEKTSDICPNHLIASPDPNIMVGKKMKIFPVEFVIRGYLSGVTSTSAWTAYAKGEREFCGNTLPEGMSKNQAFDTPIITPTTKDDEHDERITPDEIVKQGLMTQEQWDKAKEISLALFKRGTEIASERGLILVDTKYELGYDEEGTIYLCDEIHTPDSSRFWLKETYKKRIADGEEPENIDKEFLRLWFKENCDPYKDDSLPQAPDDLIAELSSRYIRLYEMITGKTFVPDTSDINERIVSNLKKGGYLS